MLHRLDNLHKSVEDPGGTTESTLTDFHAYSVNADWISAPTQPTSLTPSWNFKKVPDSTRQVRLIQNRRNIFHDCVYLNFDMVYRFKDIGASFLYLCCPVTETYCTYIIRLIHNDVLLVHCVQCVCLVTIYGVTCI
jgi:hypothetical protein